jgi:CMP-N,N'-diacetyllegionaminic acid synthase
VGEPSIVVVLRATTPLRTSQDIDGAISLLSQSAGADSVVSVVEAVGIHPIRLKRLHAGHYIVDAFETEGRFPKRRQELEKLFLRNGAVYAATPAVIDAGGLWGEKCVAYIMPEARSLNINTEHQLHVADLLLREQHGTP